MGKLYWACPLSMSHDISLCRLDFIRDPGSDLCRTPAGGLRTRRRSRGCTQWGAGSSRTPLDTGSRSSHLKYRNIGWIIKTILNRACGGCCLKCNLYWVQHNLISEYFLAPLLRMVRKSKIYSCSGLWTQEQWYQIFTCNKCVFTFGLSHVMSHSTFYFLSSPIPIPNPSPKSKSQIHVPNSKSRGKGLGLTCNRLLCIACGGIIARLQS